MTALKGRLSGKVAIVTGASKGIGAEIAKTLAAEGASVVVNYASSKTDAEKVASSIETAGGRATIVQGDVSKLADVQRLFAETKKAYGKIDILVNNAGIYEFAALEAITPEHFHKQFDLNVLGLLYASQEAVKYIGSEGGSIINISSVVAKLSIPTAAVYSATKAAVDSITRSLGSELGPRKIRVNSVNPGMVETEGTRSTGTSEGEFRKMIESQTPLGRIGMVSDIAPAVVYLASEDAKWVTGESLYISGGYR